MGEKENGWGKWAIKYKNWISSSLRERDDNASSKQRRFRTLDFLLKLWGKQNQSNSSAASCQIKWAYPNYHIFSQKRVPNSNDGRWNHPKSYQSLVLWLGLTTQKIMWSTASINVWARSRFRFLVTVSTPEGFISGWWNRASVDAIRLKTAWKRCKKDLLVVCLPKWYATLGFRALRTFASIYLYVLLSSKSTVQQPTELYGID